MQEAIKVLLVMASERRGALMAKLEACGMEVLAVSNCQALRLLLQTGPPSDVVVSDLSLEDGNWWVVRKELIRAQTNARLIVCLPCADGGVSDILEAGCFDILVPPYESMKLQRLLGTAAASLRARTQAQAG